MTSWAIEYHSDFYSILELVCGNSTMNSFFDTIILTILLWVSICKGSTKSSVDFKSKNPLKSVNELLPKLPPHEDKCYLMEFLHDGCDHADQMQPVVKRLEEDLDTEVRKINISRRKEFQALLRAVGHDDCGSYPFYYNRRTGQAVCGATSYSNLRQYGFIKLFLLIFNLSAI